MLAARLSLHNFHLYSSTWVAASVASLVSSYRQVAVTVSELQAEWTHGHLIVLLPLPPPTALQPTTSLDSCDVLGLCRVHSLARCPSQAVLSSVIVKPSARGQRLAQPLLAAATQVASDLGHEALTLRVHMDNVGAQAAYRRAGFETHETFDARHSMRARI